MNRKQQILRGMAWLFFGQLWSWGLRLVETTVVPRILGDSRMGMVGYAGNVFTIVGLAVMFGGPEHVIRSIAADHVRGARIATAQLLTRAVLLIPLLLIVYAVFRWLIPSNTTVIGLLGICMFNLYFMQIMEVLTAWRSGYSQFGVVARTQMLAQSIGIPAKIAMVRGGMGPKGSVLGDTVVGLVSLGSVILHRDSPIRLVKIVRADVAQMVREGLPYARYGLFLWLYGDATSIFYITWITHGYAATGWYMLAQKLAGVLFFIPATIVSALTPTMTDRFVRARDEYRQMSVRFVNVVLALSVPIMLTLVVRSNVLLATLYPKYDLARMTILMRVIGVELWVRWASVCYGALLVISGRADKRANAATLAAPYNLVSTPLLVYLFHRWFTNGALGALIAAETTEVIVVLIYLRNFRGIGLVRSNLNVMARALLAGVAPLLVLSLPMHTLAAFLAIAALAFIVYLPAAILTGALDLEMLRSIVRARAQR